MFVILGGGLSHGGDSAAIDGRNLLQGAATADPFAEKNAGVLLVQTKPFQQRVHAARWRGVRSCRHCTRNRSMATATVSAVRSSAGRNRIERSPQRMVSKPVSN